jgi:hypothetical protein
MEPIELQVSEWVSCKTAPAQWGKHSLTLPLPSPPFQTTINSAQFVDFLASKASKEEAMETFDSFDAEDGQVDVTWLLAVSEEFPAHHSHAGVLLSIETEG